MVYAASYAHFMLDLCRFMLVYGNFVLFFVEFHVEQCFCGFMSPLCRLYASFMQNYALYMQILSRRNLYAMISTQSLCIFCTHFCIFMLFAFSSSNFMHTFLHILCNNGCEVYNLHKIHIYALGILLMRRTQPD